MQPVSSGWMGEETGFSKVMVTTTLQVVINQVTVLRHYWSWHT